MDFNLLFKRLSKGFLILSVIAVGIFIIFFQKNHYGHINKSGIDKVSVDEVKQINDSTDKITILTYHSVNKKVKSPKELYEVSTKDFDMQIKTLKDAGYTFIDDNMLYDFYYNDKQLPKKSVLITFDDGMKNVYKYAFPILKKYNARASIYLICSYTDKKKKFLDTDMIKKCKVAS